MQTHCSAAFSSRDNLECQQIIYVCYNGNISTIFMIVTSFPRTVSYKKSVNKHHSLTKFLFQAMHTNNYACIMEQEERICAKLNPLFTSNIAACIFKVALRMISTSALNYTIISGSLFTEYIPQRGLDLSHQLAVVPLPNTRSFNKDTLFQKYKNTTVIESCIKRQCSEYYTKASKEAIDS